VPDAHASGCPNVASDRSRYDDQNRRSREEQDMNVALWVLQVLLGLYFILTGVTHFIVPDGLPGPLSWMHDVDSQQHIVAGTAEILGGLGLILPGLIRVATWLTPLAALGLIAIMLLAIVFHLGRDEIPSIVMNVVLGALLAFVAYGRWRVSPLPVRAD
jgi:uncharacterized membrane protein YphA (DoxX/SURF4 family)